MPGVQDQIPAACILNIGFESGPHNAFQVQKGASRFQPAPLLFLILLLIKGVFLILQVKPSVGLPYPNGECEPGVRYGGRSAEFVFRLRITFGAAVIIVDFLHHGMVRPPVDRPLTPLPKFGSMPVRRAIVIPPVEFSFEAVRRATVLTIVKF